MDSTADRPAAQRDSAPPLSILAALFFVSGAAGLVHEVAWSRALGQGIGTSLQGTAAVLAAFLGGLAAGAALGGGIAARSSRPLRLYGRIEIGIALIALASPWGARLVTAAIAAWGPGIAGGTGLTVLRACLAAAALLPASVAMGATLPILVRAATGSGSAPGPSIATLYGANTIGGACGAALAAFALLPLLGTRLTFVAAAIVNLAAGLAAIRIDRRRWRIPAADRSATAAGTDKAWSSDDRGDGAPPIPVLAIGAAACSGMIGAILQIGWTRVATLSFGASVYSFGTTLAAYIFGLGVGPILVARRLRARTARRVATWSIAGTAVISVAILPLLGRLPAIAAWMAAVSGQLGPALVAAQFALLFLILLPATALQGAGLPALAVAAGGAAHRGAARASAAASAGSVGGFLIAGFLLLPGLGTQRTLVIAAVAGLLLSALLAAGPRPARRPGWIPAGLIAAAAGVALTIGAPRWDPAILTSGGLIYGPIYRAAGGGPSGAMRRRGAIEFQREDGAGVVTVRRSPAGPLSLQINGRTEASTGGDLGTQLLAGHLALLARPEARRVLVIGLASGITAGAVARHPVERVTILEIAPAVVAAARRFEEANGRVLDDPRVEVVLDDARSHLLARDDLYDVITSQPSNPWVAGVANLFTLEFYRLVRSRLADGGIFCQWIQAYRMDPRDLAGVVAAFRDVFPMATLWEESGGGGDYFLVGGAGPIRIDPGRWEAVGPAWEDMRRAGIDGPAALLSRFVTGPDGLARIAAGARRHTDDNLYLEWRAPLALFRDTLQAEAEFLNRHREPPAALLPPGFLDARPDLAAALRRETARRADRLEALLALRPADLYALADPYLAAGIESLRAGRYDEALARIQQAVAASPGSAQALWLLGEAYAGAGLDGAAAVALRAAVTIDPRIAPAWIALGRRLLAAGLPEEAEAAFLEAVRVAPGGRSAALARNNLGAVRLERGDLGAAEADFVAALEIDPALAAASANLGLVLRRRGDTRGAERRYREAIAIDPLNTDARYNLARLLLEEGRAAEARESVQELLAIDPGDETARALLGG